MPTQPAEEFVVNPNQHQRYLAILCVLIHVHLVHLSEAQEEMLYHISYWFLKGEAGIL